MLPLDQIVCGDNVEVLSGFPDDCIDLTVTSPPYGELRTYGGHSWNFEGVAQQLWRITKPGGVVVWVVSDQTVDGSESGASFMQALRFKEIGFKIWDTMIYETAGFSFPSADKYHQTAEFMFVFAKGNAETFNPICDRVNATGGNALGGDYRRDKNGKSIVRQNSLDRGKRRELGQRMNVWRYSAGKGHTGIYSHPAAFPEVLARDHILSWSNEGDVVLDPFSGSGTTAKMAKHNGRRWIGIEINPEYVQIANNRLRQNVLF